MSSIWDDTASAIAVSVVLFITFLMLIYLTYTMCCRKEKSIDPYVPPSKIKKILKERNDKVFTNQPIIPQANPYSPNTVSMFPPIHDRSVIYVDTPQPTYPLTSASSSQINSNPRDGPLVFEPPVAQQLP
jgi:hypothetical protein